jgi:hypothetical protein
MIPVFLTDDYSQIMFKVAKNVKLSEICDCVKNHRAEYWYIYLVEISGAFCASLILGAFNEYHVLVIEA